MIITTFLEISSNQKPSKKAKPNLLPAKYYILSFFSPKKDASDVNMKKIPVVLPMNILTPKITTKLTIKL